MVPWLGSINAVAAYDLEGTISTKTKENAIEEIAKKVLNKGSFDSIIEY